MTVYDNNVIFVKLSKDIASTGGLTLEEDYEFYFTSTYSPLYTSVRRVRLDLGNVIRDIPEDTINLAIFEASLEADALTFGTAPTSGNEQEFFLFARRMYVTCLAEVILLGSILGSGGAAKSKRLADLDVSYDGRTDELLKKALSCMARFEAVLTSAGEIGPGTSQKPQYVVKGEYDIDRPVIGRQWQPTVTYNGADAEIPAANIKSKLTTQRRWSRDFRWPSRWNSRWDY